MVILILVTYAALWVWAKFVYKPKPPPAMMKVWVFAYRDRGKDREFIVAGDHEGYALIKYMKAGLDERKITASYPTEIRKM